MLVEVPLEDNRSAARPAKRAEAARIGHLHALNRDDVRAWIDGAGLKVLGELTDPLPFAHHAFFAEDAVGRAKAAVKWGVRAAAWKISPEGGEKFFTVHYAVLAEHQDWSHAELGTCASCRETTREGTMRVCSK